MGAGQSSLPSPDQVVLTGTPYAAYKIEACLGTGRFMKTFRIRHSETEATAVLKIATVASGTDLTQQIQELNRLRAASRSLLPVAPFLHWWLGPETVNTQTYNNNPHPKTRILQTVHLVRPHMATTLADRLVRRPWLTLAEKLFLAHQILHALQALHEAGLVHGFVTASNVGLTGSGYVVLTDLSSPTKALTGLADNDPADCLYYFGGGASLAPERFQNGQDKSNHSHTQSQQQQNGDGKQEAFVEEAPLTPAMDMFSTGCLLVEIFLNGEPCLDLGGLLAYKRAGELTQSLQQSLGKLELSAVRAACKHMLSLDPTVRLSAAQYSQGLVNAHDCPSLPLLMQVCQETVVQPTDDARLAVLARYFRDVLWEAVGRRDAQGERLVRTVLGDVAATSTTTGLSELGEHEEPLKVNSEPQVGPSRDSPTQVQDLFAETEALLRELENLDLTAPASPQSPGGASDTKGRDNDGENLLEEEHEERSTLCQNSLLIYLQMILSSLRHVQRPASKIVGLRLVERLARYSSDEARLQRIVPVTISLLQDQDPVVRATAVHVLTVSVAVIETFPPSDSKVFPQYIFKRVTHLVSDPCLVVRLAFSKCLASLAETAHCFLDVSHAVRLLEAAGSDERDTVFADNVTKLLDTHTTSGTAPSKTPAATTGTNKSEGKALINSTYNAELAGLQETVSRWVVHLTTDQSEHSSLPKRAILSDVGRLCAFFGLEGVMAFILPQILAFLNDRKDWELRAALFEQLHVVCHWLGRAATEEYILPCVEIGLVDNEERVIGRALLCLSRMVKMGLLSRAAILGNPTTKSSSSKSDAFGLLRRYGILLLHPSGDIRHSSTEAFASIGQGVGTADCAVYVIPALIPLLRFEPPPALLQSIEGLARCLVKPWTRERFDRELKHLIASHQDMPGTVGAWTNIAITMSDDKADHGEPVNTERVRTLPRDPQHAVDPQTVRFREFMRMLLSHSAQASGQDRPLEKSSSLTNGIEGSVKLAQSVMFPSQTNRGKKAVLPDWYVSLRENAETSNSVVSEEFAIRTVSSMGQVFGLSIMGTTEGSGDTIVRAVDEKQEEPVQDVLKSTESKSIEAAFSGQWGSEALLDPDLVDTSLLVTKLKALNVPPLPLKLGDQMPPQPAQMRRGPSVKEANLSIAWKPKMNTLLATSSTVSGHTAPVVRLALPKDPSFFVSGSHDGTCRIWEIPQVEESVGILESRLTYAKHSESAHARINDVSMIEGSHAIISGDNTGSVHVWRVDMVTPSSSATTTSPEQSRNDRPRAVGTSNVRTVHQGEGEILAVSHFNTASSSVAVFATQKGFVHSWDLRCAAEPFSLLHAPDLGRLTSIALGHDRNWIVTGTSRGYLALWDIRFQQAVKLWHHSSGAPIGRLATSFVPPPQTWGSVGSGIGSRPFVFAASGLNECAMFDVLTGTCRECFRTVAGDSRNLNAHVEEPPRLFDIGVPGGSMLRAKRKPEIAPYVAPVASVNCMVGSIGASDHSYLITGGSDSRIRFWDFSVPSKCFVVSGSSQMQPRPSFERIDFEGQRRLMLCRQSAQGYLDYGKLPSSRFRGVNKPDPFHSDAVEDLKIIENSALISCSRDCTVKVWR